MMMGEGDGAQPTQLVALQSEDGTQQLAVPVIDPHTGQETYMILDQSSLEGEDGQQLLIVGDGENGNLLEGTTDNSIISTEGGQILGSGEGGTLLNGEVGPGTQLVSMQQGEEQGSYTLEAGHQEEEGSYTLAAAQPGEEEGGAFTLGAGQDGAVLMIPSSVTSNVSNGQHVVYVSGTGNDQQQTEGLNTSSVMTTTTAGTNEMIQVVGLSHPSSQNQESTTTKVATSRQPRKQTLEVSSDLSQEYRVPSGLTGDLIKDTVLVDEQVDMVCSRYSLLLHQKEELRLGLMTNGLDYAKSFIIKEKIKRKGVVNGRGARGGRGRVRPTKARTAPRVIRCDQCRVEFPANTEERVLMEHVQKFHIEAAAVEATAVSPAITASPPKSYLDPDQPVGPQCYRCSDCEESFQQIKALLEHQKVAHSRDTEIVKKLDADGLLIRQKDDDKKERNEDRMNEQPSPARRERSESPSKKLEVIKKLADEWDDDEDTDGQGGETLNEEIPKEVLLNCRDDKQNGVGSESVSRSQPHPAARTAGSEPRTASRTGDVHSETLEDISKEVEGIKEAMTKRRKQEEEEDSEDRIVADVDDILSDTDKLMNSVDSMLTSKKQKRSLDDDLRTLDVAVKKQKPASVQCEECYECFEDEEKLTWHNLNDH